MLPGVSVNQIRSVVWPIFVRGADSTLIPIGSASVIGACGKHAILVSAAHIITEGAKKIDNLHPRSHPSALFLPDESDIQTWKNIEIVALANFSDGSHEICSVNITSCAKGLDTAILFAVLKDGSNKICDTKLPIKSLGPGVGSEIFAVGYFDSKIIGGSDGVLQSKLSLFRGDVQENYIRGAGSCNWPCFKVSTPFHSGMSGGAILCRNKDGRYYLSGIISRDLSVIVGAETRGSGENAIAAKIYPMMGQQFPEEFLYSYYEEGKLISEKKSSLLDCVDGVLIEDFDRAQDHLKVKISEDDGLLYYAWH